MLICRILRIPTKLTFLGLLKYYIATLGSESSTMLFKLIGKLLLFLPISSDLSNLFNLITFPFDLLFNKSFLDMIYFTLFWCYCFNFSKFVCLRVLVNPFVYLLPSIIRGGSIYLLGVTGKIFFLLLTTVLTLLLLFIFCSLGLGA